MFHNANQSSLSSTQSGQRPPSVAARLVEFIFSALLRDSDLHSAIEFLGNAVLCRHRSRFLTVDNGLEFSFENADHELSVSDDEPRIASLRSLMNELGGELRIPRSEGSVYNISLFFPNKRTGGESEKARKKEDR